MDDDLDDDLALYLPEGDGFVATLRTQGGWNPAHQHGGPVQGLLARAVEQVPTLTPMRVTRLTHDLFRPLPIGPRLTIEVEIVREGKRIQLVDATVWVGGVEHARARALRIRTEDVSDLPGLASAPDGSNGVDALHPLPAPHELPAAFMEGGPHRPGFLDGMEMRRFPVPGAPEGTHGYWVRLLGPLIAGEPTSPLQQLSVVGDFTNMIGITFDGAGISAINPDLNVHVLREPRGKWIALTGDTRLSPAAGGGVSTARLSDAVGVCALASNCQLIARRS